jgi:hypothetical protein
MHDADYMAELYTNPDPEGSAHALVAAAQAIEEGRALNAPADHIVQSAHEAAREAYAASSSTVGQGTDHHRSHSVGRGGGGGGGGAGHGRGGIGRSHGAHGGVRRLGSGGLARLATHLPISHPSQGAGNTPPAGHSNAAPPQEAAPQHAIPQGGGGGAGHPHGGWGHGGGHWRGGRHGPWQGPYGWGALGWGPWGYAAEQCYPGGYLVQNPDGTVQCVTLAMDAADATAAGTVGHGGGHGGGGGTSHTHHLYGGGGWNRWGDAGVVLACGPGQVVLQDGTCISSPDADDAIPAVQVGSPMPSLTSSWQNQEPCACAIDADGTVRLPDGSAIHASQLDFGHVAATAGRVGAPVTVGDDSSDDGGYTSTSQFPTGTETPMLPAGYGTVGEVDAAFQAINSIISQCGGAGQASPWANFTWDTNATWTTDLESWQQFLAAYQTGVTTDPSNGATLDTYQALADSWGAQIVQNCPNLSLPANFPTAYSSAPSPASVEAELTGSILPTLSGIAQAVEWAVIAVAVAVGVWFLWPVLVGARGLMAAL